MQPPKAAGALLSTVVSILIRPEGRMQLPYANAECLARYVELRNGCFNPHPARRPDASLRGPCFNPSSGRRCNARPAATIQPMFQSSSGLLAGCNTTTGAPGRHHLQQPAFTMFQSSSGQKAGCNPTQGHLYAGRQYRFNPHPARRPDATPKSPLALVIPACFNPHPARRPDATWPDAGLISRPCNPSILGRGVSILIRPEGRMQHEVGALVHTGMVFCQKAGWRHARRCFNPHPARRPDATPVSEFPICSARTS